MKTATWNFSRAAILTTINLPGTLVSSEGQGPTGDIAADEGLGATFDFFEQIFDRNSIDNSEMLLTATVHFGKDYNNAFWNSGQMVFGDGDGDGDGQIFNRVYHCVGYYWP